jgi:hypothetical protein
LTQLHTSICLPIYHTQVSVDQIKLQVNSLRLFWTTTRTMANMGRLLEKRKWSMWHIKWIGMTKRLFWTQVPKLKDTY